MCRTEKEKKKVSLSLSFICCSLLMSFCFCQNAHVLGPWYVNVPEIGVVLVASYVSMNEILHAFKSLHPQQIVYVYKEKLGKNVEPCLLDV